MNYNKCSPLSFVSRRCSIGWVVVYWLRNFDPSAMQCHTSSSNYLIRGGTELSKVLRYWPSLLLLLLTLHDLVVIHLILYGWLCMFLLPTSIFCKSTTLGSLQIIIFFPCEITIFYRFNNKLYHNLHMDRQKLLCSRFACTILMFFFGAFINSSWDTTQIIGFFNCL